MTYKCSPRNKVIHKYKEWKYKKNKVLALILIKNIQFKKKNNKMNKNSKKIKILKKVNVRKNRKFLINNKK